MQHITGFRKSLLVLIKSLYAFFGQSVYTLNTLVSFIFTSWYGHWPRICMFIFPQLYMQMDGEMLNEWKMAVSGIALRNASLIHTPNRPDLTDRLII